MTFRQRIISFLFLTLYLVAVIRPYAPYVDYYLNKEKIAEEKCINKDKVELACEGKCYLKSQVVSAQEEEKKNEQSGIPKVEFDKHPNTSLLVVEEEAEIPASAKSFALFSQEFVLLEGDVNVVVPPPQGLS